VKNLSNAITLENQFLAANEANTDYTKKPITLNNIIKKRIIHKNPPAEYNGKCKIKSMKANKDIIFNTTYNYSIGHNIFNNIQYKIK